MIWLIFHHQEVLTLWPFSQGEIEGRREMIEVKAAATLGARDFKGLDALREIAGRRFRRGIVLYTGSESLPFGKDRWALPVAALWKLGAEAAGPNL